jgi:hypothetical protein
MNESRVIEVDGVFLGAAVSLPQAQGWRIVAADARVGQLDGTVAATLPEVRRLARQAYLAAPRVVAPIKLAMDARSC